MIFSINARKVIFSVLWITIISFIASFILIFLIAANGANISWLNTSWFQVAEVIVIAILGIVIGLLWEQLTRPRYIVKITSNPNPSEHAKKIYRIVFILACIGGAIYVLSNIAVLYGASALGISPLISSTQQTAIIIGVGRYIVLALALIWLFAEPKQENSPSTSSDIKKWFLWGAIYCFLMAAVNLFGLSIFKVSDTNLITLQTPTTTTATSGETSTPSLDNSVGTMPPMTNIWSSYIFPKKFSVDYPSTWFVIGTSSSYLNISSSPTVDTYNGVCKIYVLTVPNSSGASWENWYATDQGDTDLSTSSVKLDGLPAISLTAQETEEPYISTVIDKETRTLLSNGSIADITMYCGSNVINDGDPIYQTILESFKVL